MSAKKNRVHRKLTKLEIHDNVIGLTFMAPVIFYLIFWLLIPILAAFVLSFTNYDILVHDLFNPVGSGLKFVALANYKMTLLNPIFQKSVFQTMYYSFGSVLFTTLFGLIFAIIAHNSKGKTFFRIAYYIPCVTSIASLVIIFDAIFRKGTTVTNFLALFGMPAVHWRFDPSLAMPLAILMAVWSGAGYSMLIYLAGLQEIPQSVYEAASLDSTPRFKQFLYITFPLLNNKTTFLMITGFIGSLQVYDVLQLLAEYGDMPMIGGPSGSLWSVVYYIYYVGWTQNKMGRAAAVSFILLLLIMIFTFIQRKLFPDKTY
ncbi:MAG: sugar ABC transporter permease [Angelakisella sp.]